MLKPDQKKSNLATTIVPPYKIKWIIAFLLSIVIVFTIFITFTSEEININRPPFNTLDGHRQKVISYQRQPEINCVIVGSSLSQFFREEYFDSFSA